MPRPLSVTSRHTAVVVHTQVQLDLGGVGVTADVGQTLANDGEQVGASSSETTPSTPGSIPGRRAASNNAMGVVE